MTDLELLFLVLGIIYVWECGWWARRGSLAFRTWLGKRWTVVQPSKLLGNQSAGLVLAHPLPPLGTLLGSSVFPLSISPDGVLVYVPPSIEAARRSTQSRNFFRFDSLQRATATGKKVLLNGQTLLRATSPAYASHLAAVLETLRSAGVTERNKAISRLVAESFDTDAIRRRWKEFLENTRTLRLATNLLFFYLFGVVPLLLWLFGLNRTWPALAAGLLGCTLSIAVQFYRTHKGLYPQEEDERFTHFIVLLLSPASAIRAHDLLARPLLDRFDPLAIARVFCGEREFKRFAEKFLRELRFPVLVVPLSADPLAQEAERFSRELKLARLEKFLRSNGVRPEELVQPPLRSDQTCLSFCPRCHAQFTLSEGFCSDCEGVQLVTFVVAPPTRDSSPSPQRVVPK